MDLVESHLKNMGSEHMPRTMQVLKRAQMAVAPNLDTFVFLRVNQDSSIIVDDAEGR